MTKREVASLAFTIAGIYALVQAIPLVTSIVSWFQMLGGVIERSDSAKFGQWSLMTAAILLPFAGLVFVGYVFIAHSSKFAARMFPEDDTGAGTKASAAGLQAVAFSVVGVLIIAMAMPRLLNGAAYLAMTYEQTPPPQQIPWTSWAHFGAGLLQLGLGIGLFLGRRGLANFLQRLRPLSGIREVKPSDSER